MGAGSGSGCCDVCSITGPATSECHGYGKTKTKRKNKTKKPDGILPYYRKFKKFSFACLMHVMVLIRKLTVDDPGESAKIQARPSCCPGLQYPLGTAYPRDPRAARRGPSYDLSLFVRFPNAKFTSSPTVRSPISESSDYMPI